MKKLVALLLAAAMLLSMPALAKALKPEPVAGDEWTKKAIDTVYNLDIMRGDENGDMHLEDYLTREEMFSIMYRLNEAVGLMDDDAQNTWNSLWTALRDLVGDTDNVAFWAKAYAAYNWFNKIFTGDEYGNLNPKGTLSYYECLTVMLRALGYTNDVLLANGQWRTNVLMCGLDAGLLNYIPTVDFDAPIIRRHIAIMIYNALQAYTVTSTSAGYTPNSTTLIEENFGFDSVHESDIVVGGLITAICNCDDDFHFIFDDDDSWWYFASEVGVSNEELHELYGEYVTWVIKPDGHILRKATAEELDWVEFSYIYGEGARLEQKGYKADKKTEVDYDDGECAYVRVTVGGTTYVIPKVEMLESWDREYYASYYDGWTPVNVFTTVSDYFYEHDINSFRYVDLGEGRGYVFFENHVPYILNFSEEESGYDEETGILTLNGLIFPDPVPNMIEGLEDGDMFAADIRMAYYALSEKPSLPVIYSLTKIEPISVNGGRLTASYENGKWTDVKLDGEPIWVSKTVWSSVGSHAFDDLFGLPDAEKDGDLLGYVYVVNGCIFYWEYTLYNTPEEPEEDEGYYFYVTGDAQLSLEGAIITVTVEGDVNGSAVTRSIKLPSALSLGDSEDTYTLTEAKAEFAPGRLLYIIPEGMPIVVTGETADAVGDGSLIEAGYVYRWMDIRFDNRNNKVWVAVHTPEGFLYGDMHLLNYSNTTYYGRPIEDNITSKVEGNSVELLLSEDDVETMAKLAKSMYYVYDKGDKYVMVFMANPDYDEDVRNTWENGTEPAAPAGTYFMLLTKAPELEMLGNGDVVATLEGYIDGEAATYALRVKDGDVYELAGNLKENSVVKLVLGSDGVYTVECEEQAAADFASGFVIRYVNVSALDLDKQILLSGLTPPLILITDPELVLIGEYAEEHYETLETELARYNAEEGTDWELKDIAKTAYIKYTADGVTYVIFSPNGEINEEKRGVFEDWVAKNPPDSGE